MRARSSVVAIGLTAALVGLSGGVASAQVPQPRVTLTGAGETAAGDKDGRGEFSWSLSGTQLCYLLSVRKIGTAVAAHIHAGKAGVDGAVRITLTAPTPASAGCTTVPAALAKNLRLHPASFYVNVHTAAFPAGALRAQL